MGAKKLTITLSEDRYKEIEDLSRELKEKKSKLISQALDIYFDYLDLKLAIERAKDYEDGKSKAYTIDEVRDILGV